MLQVITRGYAMQPKFEGALYQIEKALKANCMPTVSAFSHKSNCAYFTV